MANPSKPFGAIPARTFDYINEAREYVIPASDPTAVGIGDFVIVDGGSDDETGFPTAIKATAGATNKVTGVIVGFISAPNVAVSLDTKVYREASTRRIAKVIDNPNMEFIMMFNGTAADGDVSARGNINHGTALDTYTGRSGAIVDATVAADATYQLQILRKVKRPDIDIDGANNLVVVKINLHTNANASAGV